MSKMQLISYLIAILFSLLSNTSTAANSCVDLFSQKQKGLHKSSNSENTEKAKLLAILLRSNLQEKLKLSQQSNNSLYTHYYKKQLDSLQPLVDYIAGRSITLPSSVFNDVAIYFNHLFPEVKPNSSASVSINSSDGILRTTIDASKMKDAYQFDLTSVQTKFITSLIMYHSPLFKRQHNFRQLIVKLNNQQTTEFIAAQYSKLLESNNTIPKEFEKLFEESINFVLQIYSQRMTINNTVKLNLKQITHDLQGRSTLFVNRSQNFKTGKYDIHASITMVESNNAKELLPLEIFTGYRVKRFHPNEKLIEIGRMATDKDNNSLSGEQLLHSIARIAATTKRLDRIIIEVDKYRAKILARYGFYPIHERINFAGDTEYIMQATPFEFLSKMIMPKSMYKSKEKSNE